MLLALQSSLALRFQQFNCPNSQLHLQQQEQLSQCLPAVHGTANMGLTLQGKSLPSNGRLSASVGSYHHHQQQQQQEQSLQGTSTARSQRQSRLTCKSDVEASSAHAEQTAASMQQPRTSHQVQEITVACGKGVQGHSVMLPARNATASHAANATASRGGFSINAATASATVQHAAMPAAAAVAGGATAAIAAACTCGGAAAGVSHQRTPTVRDYHEAWSSGFMAGGMHGHLSPDKMKFGHLPGSSTQVSHAH